MVVVSGAALTKFNRRKDASSFRDWIAQVFASALTAAGIDPTDIDMLVFASESDFFTLQLNPASIIANDLGLLNAAPMRVEGGGASGQLAVHAGFQAIRSGTAHHVAVIGAEPSGSHLSPKSIKQLYGFSFDAWHEGMTGISATALYALSIQAFMARTGLSEDDLAQVTIKNRANACLNPNAHLPRRHTIEEINDSQMIAAPYRRLHCSPLSDGAAALILSHPNAVPSARTKAAKIVGIGAASDHIHLGARSNPDRFEAKSRAVQRACTMAEMSPDDIDLAEIYDSYAGAEVQSLEALGLSHEPVAELRQGVFSPKGKLPINLSGGLMGQGAPVGAIGVAQTATCAMLLEGTYHAALQPHTPPRFALADTHGGIATTCATTILERGQAS